MERTPECGEKLMAQVEGFSCIRCGRYVEGYETAWFSGMMLCSECYYDTETGKRCAGCFRKLESWEGRVFSDGNEYCEPCFLILSERSARKGRGAGGEQFAFN
ncbi:hypothetical protein H0N99_02425 [Candidatus Micrarchaeota archaeon]|nr:hypothetical protein [Candidatus Micrarchaeota archaeon]